MPANVAATAEATNRIAKATRLATILIQAGCTPYKATILDEPHWVLAARCANVNIPSEETRQIVRQLIAAQEMRRRKTHA